VVESVGVTRVEPSAATLPTPGDRLSEVALVEDQVSVTDSPFWTAVEDACKVTVGRAGGATTGGGGGGACTTGFLHAAPKATTASNVPNRALAFLLVRIVLLPPLAIYRSMRAECKSFFNKGDW
jgi:hypothetical protein